jgi:periplasmic protein CpxP/Spy
MNKPKTWLIIVVVLLLVNTAVLALLWFDKKDTHAAPPGGTAKDFLTRELDLTPAQQKQFEALRHEHQQAVQSAMEGMKDLKDSFFAKISLPQVDSASLDALTARMGEKERRRDLATFYHFRALRAILDAQQQKKFDGILKEVLRMMGGPHRPPPPGEKDAPPPRE